jgi:hypothetical protein
MIMAEINPIIKRREVSQFTSKGKYSSSGVVSNRTKMMSYRYTFNLSVGE